MNTLTTLIINYATGYENAFNNRVMSIESDNDIISFRFRINANKAFYYTDTVYVFANATYNVSNDTIKVVTENSTGSRKYNSYVKFECEQLVKVFVSEALKMLDVETKENNRNAYDYCHIELLSMIDSSNSTHKNICYGYINQILDMYHDGASADEMKAALTNIKAEMLSDVRLFPVKAAIEEENTTNNFIAFNRSFSSYEAAHNYCISSDFDPAFITSEAPSEPLQLDLQLFASNTISTPKQRKIYDSGYDSVRIVATNNEYIARIHPSDVSDNEHNIFFSSDDYFSIPDYDIISVTPIYKKSITTPEGVQKWGIGKGLSLTYTIETTKTDIDVDEINYSNIHKYTCKNIQSTIERINLCQRQGWHNINVITEVEYKDNTIISDASDCNIELDINTSELEETKRDNKELYNSNNVLLQEIEYYKAFMLKYKAEKTFESFKEEMKKNQSQSA